MIRDARADEVGAIADAVAGQPLLARYGTTRAALATSLGAALARGEGLLVADDEGAIAGMAWFTASGMFGALGGYLRLIAVATGQEGRGTGAQLLDEVERRVATSSRRLFLLVSHFNQGARRFYAARGYAEAGRLEGLVVADVDEILMWRRLP